MVLDQYRAMKSKKSLYKLIDHVKGTDGDAQADAVRQDCVEAAWDILQSPLALMLPNMIPTSESNKVIDICGDGHFIFEESDN